jgi:hypothetical protein
MGELPGQETLAAPAARRGALGVITAPNPDTITRVAARPGAQHLAGRTGACLADGSLARPGLFPVAGPRQLPAIAAAGEAIRDAIARMASSRTCARRGPQCPGGDRRGLTGPKTNGVPEFAPLMSELNVCVPTAPGPPGRSR